MMMAPANWIASSCSCFTPLLKIPLAAMLLLLSTFSWAGNFAVTPLRLDFSNKVKSGAITINNDGARELTVQLGLFEWTQDSTGKDIYRESEDLLYFPKLTTIGPGERKVVRVGLRGVLATAQEKSYRLFVEELPEPTPSGGAKLAVAVRFGVPLFVKPLKEAPSGLIESLSMANGQLRIKVRNTGNLHYKISSLNISGNDFSSELRGWYLLPGVTREYVKEVPANRCARLGRVNVTIKSDQVQLEDALDTTPAMCSD